MTSLLGVFLTSFIIVPRSQEICFKGLNMLPVLCRVFVSSSVVGFILWCRRVYIVVS